MLKISIVEIQPFKVEKIKQINILEICQELVPPNSWLSVMTPEMFIKDVDINFSINNHKDVMIQIKAKHKQDERDEFKRSTFYLFEKFQESQKGKKNNHIRKLIEDKDEMVYKFVINDLYIFVYDQHKIKFWCLNDEFDLNTGSLINLKISKEEKT